MVRFKIFLINFILIALASIIIISNKQIEAGSLDRSDWDEPQHMVSEPPETNFPSGLLPRGGGVDMSISGSKDNKNSKSWTASIDDSTTYFCAQHGTMLRFGKFDTTKYFVAQKGNGGTIGGGGVVIFGDGVSPAYHGEYTDSLEGSIAKRMKEAKQNVFKNYPKDDDNGYYDYLPPDKAEDIKGSRTTPTMYKSIVGKLNADLASLGVTYDQVRVYYDYTWKIPFNDPNNHTGRLDDPEDVQEASKKNLEKTKAKIFKELGNECLSVYWSGHDITDNGMVTASPTVVVMEKSPGNRGYGITGGGGPDNLQQAYILTSMCEECYGNSNNGIRDYHAVIQGAYWISRSLNTLSEGGHVVGGSSALAQKGITYQNFKSTYGSETAYKNAIKINTSKSKIAAHRDKNTIKVSKGDGTSENVTFDNGYYIVGPIKVKYPIYQDMSYLKTMTITAYDEENKATILRYGYNSGGTISPNHREFYLDLNNGTISASDANGLSTKFPESNENFYIIFGAKEANYPVRIKFEVQAEYLDDISVSLTHNRATATTYEYIGQTKQMNETESSDFVFKRREKHWNVYEAKRDANGNIVWKKDKNGADTDEPELVDSGKDKFKKTYKLNSNNYEEYNGVGSYGKKEEIDAGTYTFNLSARVYYVIMNKDAKSRPAGQPLNTVTSGTRTYRTVTVDAELTTPTPPPPPPPGSPSPSTPNTPGTPETPESPGSPTPNSPTPPSSAPPSSSPPTPGTPNTPETPNTPTPEWDNLTISLGGYVWYDAKAGKAVVTDGLYNYKSTDKPIPNMNVYLYRYKNPGTQNAESRRNPETSGVYGKDYYQVTKTDATGAYMFENLNAMYQYFVEFEYNGMYYEPIEEATGTSSFNIIFDQTNLSQDVLNNNSTLHAFWKSNSKAIDFKNASSNTQGKTLSREQLNELFATIKESNLPINGNSNNGNYRNGFVYARLWLQEKGYIDEYGLNNNSSAGYVAQFIIDSTIRAFTNRNYKSDTEYAALPEEKAFITEANGKVTDTAIKAEANKVAKENFTKLVDKYHFVNFGIKDRGTVDLALWEDTSEVNIEINGEKRTYNYGKRSVIIDNESGLETGSRGENDLDTGGYSPTFFDVLTRKGDGYYNKNSTQNLYKSDYNYKLSMYRQPVNKDMLSELRVYITYELKVKNQSSLFNTNVDEVLNYYDSKSLKYIPERSHFENGDPIIKTDEQYRITGTDTTKVNEVGHCASMTITNFGFLEAGQTRKAYLTFEVVKTTDGRERDESRIIRDEDGGGWLVLGEKVNLSEIGKYTTYYRPGTVIPNVGTVPNNPDPRKVAGIVDRDSVPGNCYSCNNKNQDIPYLPQEDDTDMAPLLTLKLYENEDRAIIGNSFEDLRTETNNGAVIGDGLQNGNDPNINGITVQLVELFPNGSEYIWREFGDNSTRKEVKKFRNEDTTDMYEDDKDFDIGDSKTIGQGTGTGSDNKCTIVTTNTNPIYYNDQKQDGYPAETKPKEISKGSGMYGFNGIVAGTYVIRFKYGDTTRTVLVSDNSEDVEAKNVSNTFNTYNATEEKNKGKNVKSYNGQDYKSTTYQSKSVNDQNINYNYTHTWRKSEQTPLGEIRIVDLNTVNTTKAGDNAYYNQNTTGSYVYSIKDSNGNPNGNQNEYLQYASQSDAKDLMTLTDYQRDKYQNDTDENNERVGTREDVILYSDENVTNALSKILAASRLGQNYGIDDTAKAKIKNNVDNLIKETSMTADTGLIEFKVENDEIVQNQNLENSGYNGYEIGHVNLGLEERPKSQIDLSKDVQNVRVALADGTIMFDASQKADNVLWTPNVDETANYKPETGDIPNTEGLINPDLNKKNTEMTHEKIKKETLTYLQKNINDHKGLIQLSMDEELMHGARLQVVYKINVNNIGEVDYKDNKFYYTGVEDDTSTNIVTTRIDKIIDYIPNNMRFEQNAQENEGIWRVIASHSSNSELTRFYDIGDRNNPNDPIQLVDGSLLATKDSSIDNTISKAIDKYNTVLELISKSDLTESSEKPASVPSRITNTELVPEQYKSKINGNRKSSEFDFLVLSQTISPENKSDDLTYRNIAEIVRYDNQVGRRMEWSVTGNQNPEAAPQELDTDRAETITILPPFGELSNYTNLIVSITIIISSVILGAGIVFIKRKIIT